jgi:hypothetical protein
VTCACSRWLLTVVTGPEETARIDSIGCTLPMAQVYDKVPLEVRDPSQDTSGRPPAAGRDDSPA